MAVLIYCNSSLVFVPYPFLLFQFFFVGVNFLLRFSLNFIGCSSFWYLHFAYTRFILLLIFVFIACEMPTTPLLHIQIFSFQGKLMKLGLVIIGCIKQQHWFSAFVLLKHPLSLLGSADNKVYLEPIFAVFLQRGNYFRGLPFVTLLDRGLQWHRKSCKTEPWFCTGYQ